MLARRLRMLSLPVVLIAVIAANGVVSVGSYDDSLDAFALP
jgi:hypothetical protein